MIDVGNAIWAGLAGGMAMSSMMMAARPMRTFETVMVVGWLSPFRGRRACQPDAPTHAFVTRADPTGERLELLLRATRVLEHSAARTRSRARRSVGLASAPCGGSGADGDRGG